MQILATPRDESRRLTALYDHQILDTPREDAFDAFVRVAAAICGTPIALISLTDVDRQWIKASVGLDGISQIARDEAFCAHAIHAAGIFEVPDASADERFATNPLVVGAPNIRFYAGVPLRTGADALGTLCVIDREPRRLSEHQRTALTALAEAVVDAFAARRALLQFLDSAQSDIYYVDLTAARVTFVNKTARRHLGYPEAELRDLPLASFLPHLAEVLPAEVQYLRDEAVAERRLRSFARRRDGSTYPVEVRVALLASRNYDVVSVIARDVTDETIMNEKVKLLSAAFEIIEDAVVISRPGATIDDPPMVVYANPAFLRLKRAPADQVIGHSVARFFGPATDVAGVRTLREKMRQGELGKSENTTYRLDGTSYRVLIVGRAMRDEQGALSHYVVIEQDVTDVVLHAERLELQNERLTALTSIARELFGSLESNALVEAFLAGAQDLVGADARLLVASPNGGFAVTHGLAVRERAPPDGDPFIELASGSGIITVSPDERRAAIRIPGSQGQTRYILDVRSQRELHTADIFALGLLGQYFAVAARNVELYHELQTRRAAVLELNQVKNDLIAMLAHDFKGPLTTIVGFADVLAEDERFDDEALKFLTMISSSAMRLASLATDTLALSRLEQNELALNIEEFDLVGLVREIADVFSVTRAVELRTDRPELVVAGDPARLRQVFENLIGNAIKYSPAGESVEVSLRAKERGVETSVRDHGIGIPDVDKSKLFGRFARAGNARAMGITGTGFGLYLSKTLVEMHGGTIGVESQEGTGSTFRVFLPSSVTAQRPKHRRFILLDADGDARSYVAHTLRDDGFAMTVVANGKELLDAIDETRFDAALVDVELVGMPLPELVRRIAGRTALVRIDSAATPQTDGWDGQLVKPFLVKDLQAVIQAAILHKEPITSPP